MGRTTRASAGAKSTAPRSDETNEHSPSDAVVADGSEAIPSDSCSLSSVGSTDGPSIPLALSPSVVLRRISIEDTLSSSSSTSTIGRKGGKMRNRATAPARTTRSQQKVSPTMDKEDSNDSSLVELIAVLDDDSKSRDNASTPSTEVSSSCKLEDIEGSKLSMGVNVKEQRAKVREQGRRVTRRSECTAEKIEKMDCDVTADNTKISEEKKPVPEPTQPILDESTLEHCQMNIDKKSDEDETASSASSNPQMEGEKSPKVELVGTRKSKRQVKVTNKYRDFVVDAPLPSSQVSYADIKMARGNGGARKSQPKELDLSQSKELLTSPVKETASVGSPKDVEACSVAEVVVSSPPKATTKVSPAKVIEAVKTRQATPPTKLEIDPENYSAKEEIKSLLEDDYSAPPQSPPAIAIQLPIKTYSNKNKSGSPAVEVEVDERSRRRISRAATPVNRSESRSRKKKDKKNNPQRPSWLESDDKTIELPGPDDRNDSTITLNLDSSYFSDDDILDYDTSSPEEFCGWPEDEFDEPGAGPSNFSFSSLSTIAAALSDPYIAGTLKIEEDTSGVESKSEPESPVVKRRGRAPSKGNASPKPTTAPVVDTAARPAGSTFIRRSYKTTRSTAGNQKSPVPSAKQKAAPQLIAVDKPEPEVVGQNDRAKPMETNEIEGVLEDAVEIVLHADEIIHDEQPVPTVAGATTARAPRRRRIRGGTRRSPGDGPLRRGRSRGGASSSPEDDRPDMTKPSNQVSEVANSVPTEPTISAAMEVEEPVEAAMELLMRQDNESNEHISLTQPVQQSIPDEDQSGQKVEKDTKSTPKKSRSKEPRRQSSTGEKRHRSRSRSKKARDPTPISTDLKKDAEVSKESPGSTPKSHDSGEIILDAKEIILPENIILASPSELTAEELLVEEDKLITHSKTSSKLEPSRITATKSTSKDDSSARSGTKETSSKSVSKQGKLADKDDTAAKPSSKSSAIKDSREITPKTSKEPSAKDSSSKDYKRSKDSRDHSSSKSKDRESSSRKVRERESSKGGKEKKKHKEHRRDKSADRSKKDKRSAEVSESEKKRSDSKDSSYKKSSSDKKRPDVAVAAEKKPAEGEKKPAEVDKKVVDVDKKLNDEEKKKESESKPATPVPGSSTNESKSKKSFETELQAFDPSIKLKASTAEEAKRPKEQDKSRKSDKHKHRSESESKKKSHKDYKEKSRSTDSSQSSSKYSSSSSSKKPSGSSSSSSSKRDSSSSSKPRKEDRSKKDESTIVKKEKVKEKSENVVLVTEQETKPLEDVARMDSETPTEKLEIKSEQIAESVDSKAAVLIQEEKPKSPSPEDVPRIATKASRKMYQGEEESLGQTALQEPPVAGEPDMIASTEMAHQQDVKIEEDLQRMSEAFDNSVQISGPRPEVALKEFQNISLSEETPPPEMLPKKEEEEEMVEQKVERDSPSLETTRESISPPSQELSNEDSNSNNSSTTENKTDQDDAAIRRSSRIKTISSQKQRTSGHGLVKDKDRFLKKTNISVGIDTKVLKDAVTGNFNVISAADNSGSGGELQTSMEGDTNVTNIELSDEYLRDMEDKLARFETIKENMYHCDKVISKEAKKMMCDCFLTPEEIERGELGCGEDCLNKLLMIECGPRCVVGERCTNKRFQKLEYANTQVFRTEKKGFGILASTEIPPGEFIMEYVGEVLNSEQFDERAELYSKEKNKHYYFMALRSDAILDATTKGNISRFINHSCDPNAETQKWTVNGELRIGFFSTRYIVPGEEITFDYQFQRYGRRAQKCYCEAENCTGWIGGDPGSDGESEYEDEEVEESEEEEEPTPEISAVVPTPVPSDAVAEATVPVVTKEGEEEVKPMVEGEPDVTKPAEPTVVKPIEPKPKKVRKRIERPKKRRPQIHEDPDLEKEINLLLKTGLKNQAHTLKLSRLMVRAKDIKSRSRLLTILQSGELPCRRLFLDYHGLRLLYGWICESTESIEDLKFRIQILDTLDRLPIPNKTMLKDSKIMQTIEKWARTEKAKEKDKEKEAEKEKDKETSSTSSPSDSNGAGSDTSSDAKKQDVVGSADVLKSMPELLKIADLGKLKEIISSTCTDKESSDKDKPTSICDVIPSAATLMDSIEIPEPEDENAPEEKRLGTQIRILSCKLLISWINLKEVFRIPKKERIEQMKEHEREADLRYKALGLEDEEQTIKQRSASSRFIDRSRDLKRRKSVDDRELLYFHKMKRTLGPGGMMMKMDNLSKQQRRQLFEMKVAHEDAERRNKELWLQHENNCMKFGLNPHITSPMDVPAKMNPATGEYFSSDDRLLPTPPSHVYFKVLPPPMPTDPDDYELPPMELPPLWRFAIDQRGRLYYYHVKERVPQWEPPKKDNPAGPGIRDEDISMSSDSSTTDTEDSEEEYLESQLQQLLKRKKKQQSSFNLDDVLAKPDDMNDDLSKTIKDLEAGDSSPRASSSGEKLMSDSFEKNAEEMLQHRKRKHSNKLVQEKIISPRTEEDKLYGQMEMKRYKETKEKLRRRKEEAKRLRARSMLDKSLSDSPFGGSFSGDLDKNSADASLIDDDLVVSHKIVDDKCIVDELDILTKKKKISPYEEWQKVKQRLGKKRAGKTGESSIFGGSSSSSSGSTSLGSSSSSKGGKRKKPEKVDPNSEEARKIKEKFRGEIAGVIVQHLGAYRKDSCQSGRITNTEDFKHLARKLTHFVLLKELKHCDNTINELEVTDSVRTKAREFIKKYMAKHGTIYIRGDNEPDYANINL